MPTGAPRCAQGVLEYDGTAFAGSQVQPNARTVQGVLEEALNRLTGERVRIRLAGRTDAGVHATGQVVAFCLPRRVRGERMRWQELQRRLNGLLPPDLAVRSLRSAAPGFDPRRDAVARIYRYRIRTGGRSRPLERHSVLEIGETLDVAAMRSAAAALVGERDFAALGTDEHGRTIRHLREVTLRRRGSMVEVRVTADAFLRRMVRSIVAVLLAVGRGKLTAEGVTALIEGRRRMLDGRAAPARGLTLEKVLYVNTRTPREAKASSGSVPKEGRRPGRRPSARPEQEAGT